MNLSKTPRRRPLRALLLAAALVTSPVWADNTNSYQVRNLVSDAGVPAANFDMHLKNGWGVAFNPNGFVWVSDNGTGLSTLYDGLGHPQSLVVTIPPAPGNVQGTPTGIVFNGSSDFVVRSAGKQGPARFIFASEDGMISGWNPTVAPTLAVPVSTVPGAVYKGLALASNGPGNRLYAADFAGGKIDVFDATFAPVTAPGGFIDPGIPADFAPFNITNLGGELYVAYAKREPGSIDEVAGQGLGFVDVFDPDGHLLRRVASRGQLDAPWGMALAPDGFGKFGGHLLVGNFGNGQINAYDPLTGEHRGTLRTPDHRKLKIDGLWGIAFGNDRFDQPKGTLFFAAGPNDEANGVYGRIDAVPPEHGKGQDESGDPDD